MQLISKFNKGIHFLWCAIDIFSKYAWVISLKDKKGNRITNAFQKILDEANCKPKKIWVDKDRKFYTSSMKLWLEKDDMETYSTYNEGKSVAAENLLEWQRTKFLSTSTNVYVNKLDDIINRTIHITEPLKWNLLM